MGPFSPRLFVTVVGACIAIAIAVSVPLGYGLIGYFAEKKQLSFLAHVSAVRISRYVYEQDSMWVFHRIRLAELIEFSGEGAPRVRQRIFTAQDKLILDEGAELSGPRLTNSAPIVSNGEVIGRLEVDGSALPFFINLLFVSLFSSTLAVAAYFSIRIFPLRALDRALEELNLRDRAAENERIRAEQEQELLAIETRRRQELIDLADLLEKELQTVANGVLMAAADTENVSRTVAEFVDSATHQTQELMSAANQAFSSVRTASEAVESVSVSFVEIDQKISQSSDVAMKATVATKNTNALVEKLSTSTDKVGEIAKVIGTIAAQTNLLALNATIEAARAGEAGRGFAVVAQEVKELANQTARATETITAQIDEIRTIITQSVDVIRHISQIVVDIDRLSRETIKVVWQQRDTTKEIAESTQRAAAGTDVISAKIDDVSQSVVSTSSAAQKSLAAANALRTQAESLTRSLDRFLVKIRAA